MTTTEAGMSASDDDFDTLATEVLELRARCAALEWELRALEQRAVAAGTSKSLTPTVIGAAIGVSASQVAKIKRRAGSHPTERQGDPA